MSENKIINTPVGVLILKNRATDIAESIRYMHSTNNLYTIDEMPNAIRTISGSPNSSRLLRLLVERTGEVLTQEDFVNVTRIGRHSFYNFTTLRNVSVPTTVSIIDDGAFEGCTSLETIELPFVGRDKYNDTSTNFGYIFGASDRYENGDYVPSSLQEVKITGETPIDDGAFFDCKDITEVDMKESLIKDIGILAFYGCTALENVTLPNSIERVGAGAFYGNDNLNYTIVDGIKYLGNEDNPYLYCEGDRLNLTRTSINIHKDCKIIGAGAFLGCVLVSSLSIPSSVEYIGDYAFRSCSRLSSVSFSSNSKLKHIGKESFRDCKGVLGMGGLTSITIPDSVEFIDRGAFRGCDKLTSITLPFVGRTAKPNERHSHFGYIFGANGYAENDIYVPNPLNMSVNITRTKYIGANAFDTNDRYNSILLHDGIEYIGQNGLPKDLVNRFVIDDLEFIGAYYAGAPIDKPFYLSSSSGAEIITATIPNDCKFIGARAFEGDIFLETVLLHDDLIDIGDYAFNLCHSLIYNQKDGLKYLGSTTNPYLYCAGTYESRNSYTIEQGCKFIGSKAFMGIGNDENRISITMPISVKVIGASAFESATIELMPQANYTFEDYEFTRIGDYAFYSVGVAAEEITKSTIKHIGKSAFKYCTFNNDLSLKGTETMEEQVFHSCRFLGRVDLTNTNLTSIPAYSFWAEENAREVSNIYLPDTIEYIGESAFENRITLVRFFDIPASLVSIGRNAFKNFKINGIDYYEPREVYFRGTADQWAMIDFGNYHSSPIRHGGAGGGVRFLTSSSSTSIIVLDKVYKISNFAFFDYRQLLEITIPATVTSIGESSFENCFGLNEVRISENALFDITQLAIGSLANYITLDEDIGKIKDYAFWNNPLTEFTIPSGCKSIGKGAFGNSSSVTPTLKTVYLKPETPPTLVNINAFPSSVERFVVTQGKLSAYQSATNWSYYANKMVEEE